jgi:hemerythrin-like domain-containing protein
MDNFAGRKTPMPDIYEAIKADHEEHRALLDRIGDTQAASDDRRAAWSTFYYEVKSHAAAEEETFYSRLISRTWGQDVARHSVHEHQELDDLMEELNGKDMASPGWLETFGKLDHDYRHHIDEEENEVFAQARKEVPADEIQGYGERFLARKREERDLVDEKTARSLED